MIITMMVSCLLLGLVLAVGTGIFYKEDNDVPASVLLTLSIICFMFGFLFINSLSVGTLAEDYIFFESLAVGDVRETVCTAPLKGKNVAALLKKPDGSYEGRILKEDPKTKVFVKTNNKDAPYAKYP